jgi:hypothetical protein
MRDFIKKIISSFSRVFTWSIKANLKKMEQDVDDQKSILIDQYIQDNLFNNPKYVNPKKLTRHEYQVYSQNGEDGIIQEIFKRIGITNKFFVEFGVDDKIECNTLLLLIQGWRGCWLDGDEKQIEFIKEKFEQLVNEKKLSVEKTFITAENIENTFSSLKVPKVFDLLSIDIDGNDYWVWKAISKYSPRVVVIEYNSMFQPHIEFTVSYDPNKKFVVQSHFGASLKSLEILGSQKGYKLVACNFTGGNAFFVRDDLVGNKFAEPFTAENHYEPPRYFLTRRVGHKRRDFGRFEIPKIDN